MKKTIAFILSLFIVSSSFTADNNTASSQEKAFTLAKEPPHSSFKYELTDDLEGVRITEYHGDDIHILIPEKIEEMPVRELGGSLFSRKDNIETVIIPDTVQSIGDRLFDGCSRLKNVHLSTAITDIPRYTFSECKSLESFIIPTHITNIEEQAFSNSGLKSINIPDMVTFLSAKEYSSSTKKTEVSGNIFWGCKNLETVRLPASMTTIGSGMFSGCESLRSITLPEGITEIGESAFAGCSSLTELTIPDSVTAIRKGAFDNIEVKSLVIPDSVTTLECSFGLCSKLEYLHLSNALTEISNQLLVYTDIYPSIYHRKKRPPLKAVNLPASLKKLDTEAFADLEALQELTIPDSITKLEFSTIYYDDTYTFKGTPLPLITQKRLKQLGYPGKF